MAGGPAVPIQVSMDRIRRFAPFTPSGRKAAAAPAPAFRTEPRGLAASPDGYARIIVEGDVLLHSPGEPIPYQLERSCTRCGTTDPRRWSAPETRTIAGVEVRVPFGHVCFWCRCWEFQGQPAGDLSTPTLAGVAAVAAARPPASPPAPASAERPWWRTLAGVPAWAAHGPLRTAS
jgi:hypothetical protein